MVAGGKKRETNLNKQNPLESSKRFIRRAKKFVLIHYESLSYLMLEMKITTCHGYGGIKKKSKNHNKAFLFLDACNI